MRPLCLADDMPADWPQGLKQPRGITRLHNPGPFGRKAGKAAIPCGRKAGAHAK